MCSLFHYFRKKKGCLVWDLSTKQTFPAMKDDERSYFRICAVLNVTLLMKSMTLINDRIISKYYSWFRDWNISAKAQSPSKILFYHLAQTEMPLNDLPRIDKRESTFRSNEWMSEKKKKKSRQITEIFRHNKTRTYYIVFSPWIHLKIQCLVGVGANTKCHQATLWIPFNSEMPQVLNTEKTLVSSLGQTFLPEGGILWCRHDTNIKEMLLSAAEWVLGRQRKNTNSIWRQTPKSFKASRRESAKLQTYQVKLQVWRRQCSKHLGVHENSMNAVILNNTQQTGDFF